MRTGGNPRTSPIRGGGAVPSLLKVFLGMRWFGVLGAWWEFSERCSDADNLCFRRPAGARISFFFIYVFSFGLRYDVAPTFSLYRAIAIY
jgi:hypothetical protein